VTPPAPRRRCRSKTTSTPHPSRAPQAKRRAHVGHPQIQHRRHEGYIIVGLYPDGEPGEIFIKMAKEGSTVSGLMDSFALAVSISLQHGVPLNFSAKNSPTPASSQRLVQHTDIGFAKSIMDYIFRWLQLRFLSGQQQLLFDNLRPRALGLSGSREHWRTERRCRNRKLKAAT